MSQHDQDLQQEQQLLEHFRKHSQGEPSAALDAMILAAAREALAQPRPSWSQRLHAWLFGAGSRTRWSMAVAGLAVFGIGLNLALQNREQLPQSYDAPPALASAPAPAAQAMEPQGVERKKAEQHQESNTAFAVSPSAAAAPRQMAPAKPQAASPAGIVTDAVRQDEPGLVADDTPLEAKAKATRQQAQAAAESVDGQMVLAEEATPLEERLRHVLRLRAEGQREQADQLLVEISKQHPDRDLDAELARLKRN